MHRTPAILALAAAAAVSGCMDPSSAQTERPAAQASSAAGAPSPDIAEEARDAAGAPAAPTGGGTRRYAERIPFN